MDAAATSFSLPGRAEGTVPRVPITKVFGIDGEHAADLGFLCPENAYRNLSAVTATPG